MDYSNPAENARLKVEVARKRKEWENKHGRPYVPLSPKEFKKRLTAAFSSNKT